MFIKFILNKPYKHIIRGECIYEKRPTTTLFMLESLDGKISSGNNDSLDADKDFCRIDGIK